MQKARESGGMCKSGGSELRYIRVISLRKDVVSPHRHLVIGIKKSRIFH